MQNKHRLNELLSLVDKMHDGSPVDRVRIADSRDGMFYLHDQRIRLALKVSLITGRPLLMVGPPGCGKSSLAPYVARNLHMTLLTYTVTETAEASDMLWRMDYLGRLNDAQRKDMKALEKYVEKGVLWRAFAPEDSVGAADAGNGTLVLIDEIDKANAGFANSLLVALGSFEFDVPPLSLTVKAKEEAIILVMMTSNEERELPPALLRRCITLELDFATAPELVKITTARWPDWMQDRTFRDAVESLATSLSGSEAGGGVSTAEFLDLVQVLKMSGVAPGSEAWRTVEGLVLLRGGESDG